MGMKKASTRKEESRIVVFQEKTIRRICHNNEWWFSVIDVVGALSESDNPKRYWSDLKRKMAQESGMDQPYEKIVRLKLEALQENGLRIGFKVFYHKEVFVWMEERSKENIIKPLRI